MESLLKPGWMVEIGSEEWKVHVIKQKAEVGEIIKKLQGEIAVLQSYLLNLENTK